MQVSNVVPREDIERIVGVYRHPTEHYARAVSREERVYILHSAECLGWYADLRECPFSLALDEGIDLDEWDEDMPLPVDIIDGRLVPDTDQEDARRQPCPCDCTCDDMGTCLDLAEASWPDSPHPPAKGEVPDA